MDWIDGQDLFGFKIEKREMARSGGRPYAKHSTDKLNIVLHTTEGSTLAGALSTFAASPNNSSHFVVGQGRIVQLRPLNAQGGALRANSPHNPNDGAIQIENIGFSKETLWIPDDGVLKPLAGLLAYLSVNLNVPLSVPNDWPDDCSDIKTILSSNNTRRKAVEKTYPAPQGVWMHLEIPWQQSSWHWDMGKVRRSVILQQAQELADQLAAGANPAGGPDPQPNTTG